jgi:hypothetical protein
MTGKPARAIAAMALLLAASCTALAPGASAARPLEDVEPLILAVGDIVAQEIRDAGGQAIDLAALATATGSDLVLWVATTEQDLNAYAQGLERTLADDADAAVAGLVATVQGAHSVLLHFSDESLQDLVDALRALQGLEERGSQRLLAFEGALLSPLPGVIQDTFDIVPLPTIPVRITLVISVGAAVDALTLLTEQGLEGLLADPTQPVLIVAVLVGVDIPAMQAALLDYVAALLAAIDDVPGPATAYANGALLATTAFASEAADDATGTAGAIVGTLSD